MADSWCFRTHW